MKKTNRVTAAFGAVILVCTIGVGALSALAAGGDEDDPLVTLSYLTEVVTPELLDKVDEQVAANEEALTERLDKAIASYAGQLEESMGQGTVVESASFVVVPLNAGETLFPEAGSELLLRSGQASVTTGLSPALLNGTDGSVLEVNGTLTANHLYVVPLESAAITASASCVLLVRGDYTIS